MKILENLNGYEGLKTLPKEKLPQLCEEIRKLMIEVVERNGGHLASSLGAVELIVSLLRVFDPRKDRIIFDVGHQAYAYKMLTDRLDSFPTLRQSGGLSGFPKRRESPFDHFDVGHSSTSISAALGFAKARDLLGQDHEVVAVIGDGALYNGVALEALNNVKEANTRLTVIFNDNSMSISRPVGGLADYLARLAVNPYYKRFKEYLKEQCRKRQRGESLEELLSRSKTRVKTLLQPNNIFEGLGISYWGPFDGHDLDELAEILGLSRFYGNPLLIHLRTKKGKGYPPAEADPTRYHGLSPRPACGSLAHTAERTSWSDAISGAVMDLAEGNDRIVCLTADMKEGTRLNGFAKRWPNRCFDVGIAEEHLLTYAAGLAAGGLKPFVFVYSTFLQRAMDQMVHDIAMQELPVVILADRAGLVGEDGETHHGLLDVCWGRAIPGIAVMAPRDIEEARFMLAESLERGKPALIRFPRGAAAPSLRRTAGPFQPAGWGKAETLVEGEGHWTIMAYGKTVSIALDIHDLASSRGLPKPDVVDLRFVEPADWDLIEAKLASADLTCVIEDGYRRGGFGEAVAARANSIGARSAVLRFGIPDSFVPHATVEEQWKACGLDAETILEESLASIR
jgi:1-deoxy-D-xylulose-5-phosphate synthase